MVKKNKKLFIAGIIILLTIFSINHIEYYFRINSNTGEIQNNFKVRREDNSLDHSTIGIDEETIMSTKNDLLLFFSTLSGWEYDPEDPKSCPKEIEKLNGKKVSCIGFMYPLTSGEKLRLFCLLRTTQTCCYGPRPQYNQYIFVEMAEPIKFSRLKPIIVQGTFFIDPRPDEGYIYRIEGISSEEINDSEADIDINEASEITGYSVYNFSLMENLKKNREGAIIFPEELLSLDGTSVILNGFLVGNTKGALTRLIVGKYWWDGVMQGTQPNIYNAVMVFPKNEKEVPPLWKRNVVFTGKIHINKDPFKYSEKGIVSIINAQSGVPAMNRDILVNGPFLPVWLEVVISGFFLLSICIKHGKNEKKYKRSCAL